VALEVAEMAARGEEGLLRGVFGVFLIPQESDMQFGQTLPATPETVHAAFGLAAFPAGCSRV
jgi:hypothetical protein